MFDLKDSDYVLIGGSLSIFGYGLLMTYGLSALFVSVVFLGGCLVGVGGLDGVFELFKKEEDDGPGEINLRKSG